jgi:hypothetical protein
MPSLNENIENKQSWETILEAESITPVLYVHNYDTDKVILCPIGDEHIGSKFYDADKHKEILEWCYKEKTPIILMGDELETATKTSVGAGIFEQDDIVQRQLERAVLLYKPLADAGLLIGNHIGNHEARVYQHSGANLSKILADMLHITYLGVGAIHLFNIGNQQYTMYTTHGTSGARLPHTKIANTIKMSNMASVMIYCQGHLHQLSHHVQNYYRVDLEDRTIKEAQRHYIICGSYLKHWGSYAHISNMEPSRIGSPKIKLSGEKHQIRVSLG